MAAILLLAGSTTASAAGILTGRVLDGRTGEPLIGATVKVNDSGLSSATDLGGHYEVSGIPGGDWTAKVSYYDYESAASHVSVVDGCTTKLDVRMLRPGERANDSIMASIAGIRTTTFSSRASEFARANAVKAAAWRVYLKGKGRCCIRDTLWGVEGDTIISYLLVEDGRCRVVIDSREILVRMRTVSEYRYEWMALLNPGRRDTVGDYFRKPFNGHIPTDGPLIFYLKDAKRGSFATFY